MAERSIRRPRHRCEDNIKMCLKYAMGVQWMHLGENRNVVAGCCGYGNKHWMSIETGNFLITSATVDFSEMGFAVRTQSSDPHDMSETKLA